MYVAFPPNHHVWWLAPVALGVLYAVMTVGSPSTPVRQYAATSPPASCSVSPSSYPCFLDREYVGPLPWLALAVVMAIYTAVFGALASVTMRLRFRPLWFALSWVTIEAIRSAFPSAGFHGAASHSVRWRAGTYR